MLDHKYIDADKVNNITRLEYLLYLKICKNPANGAITGIKTTCLTLPNEILNRIG